MKMGFVGLGQMGKHIAMNLLRSGSELIVTDVRKEIFAEFREKGAQTTSEMRDIAGADIIFLCLPDSEIVKKVLTGEKGLIHNLRGPKIVVDLSTIKYSTTLEISKALDDAGISFLDAPVSGMEERAKDATLTVMCGGKKEVFDKVKPLFEFIGNNILYMGKAGSGQLTKLINQLLFDINAAGMAEVLPMAIKLGLDPEKVGQVVNSGTGGSYASKFFIPRILEGNFGDGYPLKHAYKDLVSAAEMSANLCVPMPVLSAATATYQTAMLKGHGDTDKGSMIKVYEELLGVSFRSVKGK
jgi:3-hydroxyisobutyrate dehydrogenase-like beta-hydroxyacid dehydrogenase